jgi:hypothetical protein
MGKRNRYTTRRVNIEATPLAKDSDSGGVLYALADGKRHGVGKRVWVSGAR